MKWIKKIISFFLKLFFISELPEILTTTIGLVAFLLAINYFTAKPEITMQIGNVSPRFQVYYEYHNVKKFYKENDLKMPRVIEEDKSLGYLFKKDRSLDFGILGYQSTPYYINNYLKHQGLPVDVLKLQIDTLEAQLDNFRSKEDRASVRGGSAINIKDICSHYKNILSYQEYFIFISAILRTRVIENYVSFETAGDVNLNNIILKIYSPLSAVNQNRTGNIKNIRLSSLYNISHNIKDLGVYYVVEIPFLESGKKFMVDVITKENMITSEEIILDYDYSPFIKITNLWIYLIIIFFFLIIYKYLFQKYSTKVYSKL